MNANNRTRKLVVQISESAYQALQKESVRIDRHAFNVASEVVETALHALAYRDPDFTEEGAES